MHNTDSPLAAPVRHFGAAFHRTRVRLQQVIPAVCLAITLIGAATVAQAQSKPDLKPIQKTVTTTDNWQIAMTYYPSGEGKDAAVVMLIHGEGENQLVWEKNGLALRLQEEGFAVATLDIRKHGQSKHSATENGGELNKNDWSGVIGSSSNFTGDIEAVKKFLLEEHADGKLNIEKLAVVGVKQTAPAVLAWSAADWLKLPYNDSSTLATRTPRGQDVKAVVLLSPADRIPGLSSALPVRTLSNAIDWADANPNSNLSFLMLGSSRGSDNKAIRGMEKQLSTARKFKGKFFKELYSADQRGTDLIPAKSKPQAVIVGFLKQKVQDLDVPWRNRVSRLNRED